MQTQNSTIVRPDGTPDAPFVLAPGTYRIGDPCYSIPRSRWMEWLNAADYRNAEHLAAPLDGHAIVALHTDHGDGEYPDQMFRRYGVDAGLIGAVPVEMPDLDTSWGKDAEAARQGAYHVHTFTEPTPVWADEDGTLNFGRLQIFTGFEDEEEDEDEPCGACGEPDCFGECLEYDEEDV